jgi:hypothetical protein
MDQEVWKGCSLLAQHLCNSRFQVLTAVLQKMHIFCNTVIQHDTGQTSDLLGQYHKPGAQHLQLSSFNTCNNTAIQKGTVHQNPMPSIPVMACTATFVRKVLMVMI